MAAARALPPVRAGLAGALWGVSYYTAAVALPIPIFTAHLGALALLGLVSSGYCLLASLATRALGFAPLMLALLWVLVEALLHPLGLRGGLLAGTQVEMGWSAWLARALGYVFEAFAVVYANALLLSLIERTSVRLETDVTLSCAAVYPIRIFQQTDQSRTDANSRSHPPRAPPVFR